MVGTYPPVAGSTVAAGTAARRYALGSAVSQFEPSGRPSATRPSMLALNSVATASKFTTEAKLSSVPVSASVNDVMPSAGSVWARVTLSDQSLGRDEMEPAWLTVGIAEALQCDA